MTSLDVADAVVLFVIAASIFGAPALALLCAVREFRRRARAGFSPTAQSIDIGGAPGKVVLRVVGKSWRSRVESKKEEVEMKVIRNLPAMAALAVALTIASQARADVISFYLTTTESGGTISQSSAVEVTVDLTSDTAATVTFTGTGTTGTIVTPVELNILGQYSATATGNSSGTIGIAAPGTGSEDTFGTMSLETGTATGNHTITIDLTAGGTNSWASAANVLTPTCGPDNGPAHPSCVLGYMDPITENEANSSTGYGTQFSHGFDAEVSFSTQDAGEFVPVPEPSTLALFGGGLLAFFGVAGRHRQNA
jgi:PEP-CTERM motif